MEGQYRPKLMPLMYAIPFLQPLSFKNVSLGAVSLQGVRNWPFQNVMAPLFRGKYDLKS